jgi:hypothetical protein
MCRPCGPRWRLGSPQYAVLTQVPAQGDAFSRAEILLNTSRIAFVRAG